MLDSLVFQPFQFIVLFIILLVSAYLYARSKKKLKLDPKRLIVVVTGCDSGFGLTTTEKLSALGFQVVAACLTQEGTDRLKGRVTLSIKCDVTNAQDISKLRESVESLISESGCKLWALINNAGVAHASFFDWTPDTVIRQMMDVNYFGLVNITRALLPMLKRCERSRIVNLSSVAGFASGGAGMSGYFASKYAVEGLCSNLRIELAYWNVHVCNINPGFMRTPLIESTIAAAMRLYDSSAAEVRDTYPISNLHNIESMTMLSLEDPAVVVNELVNAVFYAYPGANIYPGMQAKAMILFSHIVPRELQIWIIQWAYFQKVSGPKREIVRALQK